MRALKNPRERDLGVLAQTLSYLLLALPTVVLGLLAFHTGSPLIAGGAVVQLVFMVIFRRANPVWQPPVSGSIVVLYLVALAMAWAPIGNSNDPVPHLAQGFLFIVAVGLFAYHDLIRTGAEPLRRANKWSRRIANRRAWPTELAECRTVPEAIALRNAMHNEPTPALALLMNARQEVQVAALGALEHHPQWRSGEAEMVMRHAHKNPEPAIRAAAVYALAGVETAELITELATFLRDPAAEVRLATAEALMWNSESRWPFAREMVKEAMADPKLVNDGPMFTTAGRLPAAAIADLITWSAEHPPLARRAILTVVEHFHGDLLNAEKPELANEIATMMLSNETPPALRVELAGLLRDHHMLTPDLLDRLTNMNQPAPMRLFAAELMLRLNPNDPDGVDVLRGLARQPNRELALSIAAVLQNILGMQLGLPSGAVQPQSKQAAEVAKRVLAWANGASAESLSPTPGPRPGLKPGSRGRAPGLGSRPKSAALPPTPPAGMPVYTNPLDESMLPPGDGAGFLNADDLLAPPSMSSPLDEPRHAPRSPLDESMLAPPRSPLDESMLAPRDRDLYDDSMLRTPGSPRNPLEESMLLEGEPLAEDDLLAPPNPRSPLDESMLAPEPPPVIPPLIPPSKKPFKRPGPGPVF
ncbi:MAG: HEAT repeat domain-containing protein [Planctomycetes bacterium]|nr:HEAT repeat domain-containing protein [Planctomycetota bacterium]